ncbi:MAG: N-acetylglucosamine-6-phosphate deacetylase [Roseibium sp.]
MTNPIVFKGGAAFDGEILHKDAAMRFGESGLEAIGPVEQIKGDAQVIDLGDDLISPGYVDLQVNGGGGVMLNTAPSVEAIRTIAKAHWSLGTRALLPTLITDTREKTQAAIAAVSDAIAEDIPGVIGLHLEGPHLSVTRKGAHDAAHIRKMDQADLEMLLQAARSLPALMITIAPENVSLDQVRVLSDAGAVVSLGHTDADFATCMAYVDAGARCATHLFNAMSQLGNREPGLVGAALSSGNLSVGLIADGIHVHTDTMKIALSAKQGPGQIFLVSDSMAVAGSNLTTFELDGRRIFRADGKLTLENGTLAGADLDLTTAIRVLVTDVGIPLNQALKAATKTPHDLISSIPFDVTGRHVTDFIRIRPDLTGVTPLMAS